MTAIMARLQEVNGSNMPTSMCLNRNVCLAAGWRIRLISRIWCISRPIHANALDEWRLSWTATRHGPRTKLWAAPAAFSRAHTRGKGSLIRRYCCCNPHASQGAADNMLHGGVLAPLLRLDCFALLSMCGMVLLSCNGPGAMETALDQEYPVGVRCLGGRCLCPCRHAMRERSQGR